MGKPCGHAETYPGCRLCYLAEFDGRYQRLWGLEVTAPDVPTPPPPGVNIRVNFCPNRKRWDWSVTDAGLTVASGSEESEDAAKTEAESARERIQPAATFTPGRRHLLYHVLPVAGNGIWQRNLDQLKWRLGLFNGRKVVAVVTGDKLDPPGMVADYLDGCGCEILTVPNDPVIREVATWEPLWDRLADVDPADVAFYFHAKGVTRPVNPGVTVHEWARLLYSGCLDFWPEVEEQLGRFPVTGMFKKVGHGFQGSRSAWHYSGTAFWIRVGEVFAGNRYRTIDRSWTGTEAWVGLHFHPDAGGCLFHTGRVPMLDLYSFPYVQDRVLPEFRRWALAARRTPCLT